MWFWPWQILDQILTNLRRIEAKLDRLLDRGRPVHGRIFLCGLVPTNLGECDMAGKSVKMVAVPNFSLAELATKGALLQLFDAGDNPAPLPTTPFTTTWSSGDVTVLTVTADPVKPEAATVASLGKIGTKVPVKCLVHATDTPPSFADVDAECTIDVPAGPIKQGIVQLAP